MNQDKLSTQITPVPLCQAPSASTQLPCPHGNEQLLFCSCLFCHGEPGLGGGGFPFLLIPKEWHERGGKRICPQSHGQCFSIFFPYDLSHSPSQSPECDSGKSFSNPICFQGLFERKAFLGIHCSYLAASKEKYTSQKREEDFCFWRKRTFLGLHQCLTHPKQRV